MAAPYLFIVSLSVILRSRRTSELALPLKWIAGYVARKDIEVIAVCSINDVAPPRWVKLMIKRCGRLRARLFGVEEATGDGILFLDSDQVPSKHLLEELKVTDLHMAIIRERSLTGGFVGLCLDDWRLRMERLAMRKHSPELPVVPRFYRRRIASLASQNLPDEVIDAVVSHEDSVFYYEATRVSHNIGFANGFIFNAEPSLLHLMRKAFAYGESAYIASRVVSRYPETGHYLSLIRELDNATLRVNEIGIGPGYVIQTARATAYLLGRLRSAIRLSSGNNE